MTIMIRMARPRHCVDDWSEPCGATALPAAPRRPSFHLRVLAALGLGVDDLPDLQPGPTIVTPSTVERSGKRRPPVGHELRFDPEAVGGAQQQLVGADEAKTLAVGQKVRCRPSATLGPAASPDSIQWRATKTSSPLGSSIASRSRRKSSKAA